MIPKCKKHNKDMDYSSSLMNNWYCKCCDNETRGIVKSEFVQVKKEDLKKWHDFIFREEVMSQSDNKFVLSNTFNKYLGEKGG